MPDSPRKESTPKRRRTLFRDEMKIPVFQEAGNADAPIEITRLAGTKHRDSRPKTNGADVDLEMLASKGMFRPQSTKRRSSISVQQVLESISNTETKEAVEGMDTALTQALAAELASFANGVTQAVTDSRK